jgi:hypothetical protein
VEREGGVERRMNQAERGKSEERGCEKSRKKMQREEGKAEGGRKSRGGKGGIYRRWESGEA